MIVTLLQWNLWYKEDPHLIVQEIKKLNPDIICAQELIIHTGKEINTPEKIASCLKYDYVYQKAESWDNREEKESQGNAIFYRLPLIKTSFTYIQDPKHNPPSASYEGRVYLKARFKVNKKFIDIATVHLSYSPCFKINPRRRKEADNLINIIKKKSKSFVFTGDLNATPSSYVIKKICQYLKNAGPDFQEKTWTTRPFDYHGFQEDKLNWRLDYVFTSPDVQVIKAEIIKTTLSDHLPILIRFRI